MSEEEEHKVAYLVDFGQDTIITLTTPDESEKFDLNQIFLTVKERMDFMSADMAYWAWQRKLRMLYRTRHRDFMEAQDAQTP